MWPMLYTEHDLEPVPGALGPRGGPDLVRHWLAADSTDELQRCMRTDMQALGFDWMSHASVIWREGTPSTTRLLSTHAHPCWTQFYFGEGGCDVDPLLQQAMLSPLPLAWSTDDVPSRSSLTQATPEQERFADVLRGCGVGSGVLVVLPAAVRSNECTIVSMMSPHLGRSWMTDEALGGAFMFALCLHELLTTQMRLIDGTAQGALASATRREILHQLTLGQSNKQIAYRLQLSADTVKYHLRELRRHFNVRNRIELVNCKRSLNHAVVQLGQD